jgi:hypothetical protein
MVVLLLCCSGCLNILLTFLISHYLRRDSAVGIATGYGLDDRGAGFRVPVGSRIFSSPRRPDPRPGPTQLPVQWVPGTLSPEVKGPGREADHSTLTSVEVNKMWIHTSTPTSSWRCT